MSKQVRITAFTDPACTWCWGSEPMLRAVQTRFGDQVQVRPVMGGLVKDIRAFMDTANGIGGNPERSNAQIAAHWLHASARHGMPVKTDGFRMFTEQDISTWPMCEAFEAAKLQGDAAGNRYLRRLREATAAEARQTNRVEVQAEVATEVGLDLGRFLGALRDGTARAAFEADLAETARHRVRGADREVTVALGLSDQAWGALEPEVLHAPGIDVEPAGNGRFLLARSTTAATCDAATGSCTI